MKRSWAAVSIGVAAALFLSACGAQPANLPTATPFGATPTPGNVIATATPNPAAAEPAASSGAAAEAAAVAAPSGDRPFAAMSPAQRGAIGAQPPPMTIDPAKKYVATIKTSKGDIVVELDPSAAPNTVNNFIYLAQNGYYDGLTFHRVVDNFVIQGGDPLGDGTGGPGYNVPPEIKLKHADGAIAMARRGGDPATTPSSGSQFYITIGEQKQLDDQYTVFGKTTRGQDVVRKIQIGDLIERIDIATADGSAVAAAPPQPTPVPQTATCAPYPLNIVADDHMLGKADAPVTIIEYGDFQCPACAQLHPSLKATMQQISDTARLVFRHFPLAQTHDKAIVASRAAEAASMQDKFWEMHDLLYSKQGEWSARPVAEITNTLKTYAQDLKLDVAKFEQDLANADVAARVERDMNSGEASQVGGTPTLFFEGRAVPAEAFVQPSTAQDIRNFAAEKAKELASQTAKTFNFTQPDQVVDKDATYQMTVKTTRGDVVVELDPALAPTNVNSTVFLAQKGYFEGAPIVRNDAQLGAVLVGNPTAAGNPGYDCGVEAKPGLMDKAGVVALFGNEQRSNAQLVFTYTPTQQLDNRYSVIGQITSGLDIVKSLQEAASGQQADKIVSVTVVKK
jgi:cyclophilin family peptidyl-prolyl cis-trans isomerase/predicted DsbA family dithiol-disulfide isomerase